MSDLGWSRGRILRIWARPIGSIAAACVAIVVAVMVSSSDPFALVLLAVPAAGLFLLGLLLVACAFSRPWRERNPAWEVRAFSIVFWLLATGMVAFAALMWIALLRSAIP